MLIKTQHKKFKKHFQISDDVARTINIAARQVDDMAQDGSLESPLRADQAHGPVPGTARLGH